MHSLIAGTTLSGKSTLARKLARAYADAGRQVIVLDRLMDAKWKTEAGAFWVTDDPDAFLDVFWASRNLVVIIDESGSSVGRFNKPMIETATQGRHWGHIMIYISQRAAQLSKDVRGMCAEVYAFASDEATAESLKDEFIQPELMKITGLQQGEFIHAMRFGPNRKPYYEYGDIFE